MQCHQHQCHGPHVLVNAKERGIKHNFCGSVFNKGNEERKQKKGETAGRAPEENHAGHGVSAGNGYRPSKKCVRGQASFMENLRMFCRAQRPSKDLSCEAVHQIYNFHQRPEINKYINKYVSVFTLVSVVLRSSLRLHLFFSVQ